MLPSWNKSNSIKGRDGELLENIPQEWIEKLTLLEHDRWMEERRAGGYTYGDVKDTAKWITPYLVSYDQLSEDIKEKDCDIIRNIPVLLERIGMAA